MQNKLYAMAMTVMTDKIKIAIICGIILFMNEFNFLNLISRFAARGCIVEISQGNLSTLKIIVRHPSVKYPMRMTYDLMNSARSLYYMRESLDGFAGLAGLQSRVI